MLNDYEEECDLYINVFLKQRTLRLFYIQIWASRVQRWTIHHIIEHKEYIKTEYKQINLSKLFKVIQHIKI